MNAQAPKTGRAAILIVHALFWAVAILAGAFDERPWGDDFLLWMVVGFNLSNGLLMLALGIAKKSRC